MYLVLSQNGDSIRFTTTRGQSCCKEGPSCLYLSPLEEVVTTYIRYRLIAKRFQDFTSADHVYFDFTELLKINVPLELLI